MQKQNTVGHLQNARNETIIPAKVKRGAGSFRNEGRVIATFCRAL
jgi:hypothetical protein